MLQRQNCKKMSPGNGEAVVTVHVYIMTTNTTYSRYTKEKPRCTATRPWFPPRPSLPSPLAPFATCLPLTPWSPNLGHQGARGRNGRMGTSETIHEASTKRQATVQSKQRKPAASQQGAARHLGCKEMAGQLLNAWKLVFVSSPPVTSSPV